MRLPDRKLAGVVLFCHEASVLVQLSRQITPHSALLYIVRPLFKYDESDDIPTGGDDVYSRLIVVAQEDTCSIQCIVILLPARHGTGLASLFCVIDSCRSEAQGGRVEGQNQGQMVNLAKLRSQVCFPLGRHYTSLDMRLYDGRINRREQVVETGVIHTRHSRLGSVPRDYFAIVFDRC